MQFLPIFPAVFPSCTFNLSTLNFSLAPVYLHIWIWSLYKRRFLCLKCPALLFLHLPSKGTSCVKASLIGPDTVSCSMNLKNFTHATKTAFIRLGGNLSLLDCKLLYVKDLLHILLFLNLAQCLENNSSKNCVWNEWMKCHLLYSVVIKSLDSCPRLTGFGSWLCHLLAGEFDSLCLNFLIQHSVSYYYYCHDYYF